MNQLPHTHYHKLKLLYSSIQIGMRTGERAKTKTIDKVCLIGLGIFITYIFLYAFLFFNRPTFDELIVELENHVLFGDYLRICNRTWEEVSNEKISKGATIVRLSWHEFYSELQWSVEYPRMWRGDIIFYICYEDGVLWFNSQRWKEYKVFYYYKWE